MGTSCLPGLDLQLGRKIPLNRPLSTWEDVTARLDLPVGREGGQGIRSPSVCWTSAPVNTSWGSWARPRRNTMVEAGQLWGSGLRAGVWLWPCAEWEHVCVYVSVWSELKSLAFIMPRIIACMCVRDHMHKCLCGIKAILFPTHGVTKANERLVFLITPFPPLYSPSNIPKWELCVRLQHCFCFSLPLSLSLSLFSLLSVYLSLSLQRWVVLNGPMMATHTHYSK